MTTTAPLTAAPAAYPLTGRVAVVTGASNVEPGLVTSELREKVDDADSRAAVQEWDAQAPPIAAEHVGDLIAYLANRARDVNVPQLSIMPTHQV